jgi:hypothetical protein
MYFYHKALQSANGSQVDINEFRYAGPKPNTKESAVVMLADTIEAAVRSMKSPTPKAIDQFIERLVRGKLEDDQLSDSPLSLNDIDDICQAFSGILKGVYHERIEYPNVPHYAKGGMTPPAGPAASAPVAPAAPAGSAPSADSAATAASAAQTAASDVAEPGASSEKTADAGTSDAAPPAGSGTDPSATYGEPTAAATTGAEKRPEGQAAEPEDEDGGEGNDA